MFVLMISKASNKGTSSVALVCEKWKSFESFKEPSFYRSPEQAQIAQGKLL